MKKLEIKKTKPTFIISVLVVLVSLIYNFFTNKTSLANKWMTFSSSNSALVIYNIQGKKLNGCISTISLSISQSDE